MDYIGWRRGGWSGDGLFLYIYRGTGEEGREVGESFSKKAFPFGGSCIHTHDDDVSYAGLTPI